MENPDQIQESTTPLDRLQSNSTTPLEPKVPVQTQSDSTTLLEPKVSVQTQSDSTVPSNIVKKTEETETKEENKSQKSSETVETVKNDSFWDKYKHYLLIIAFVGLLYFAYMYYCCPDCNFNSCQIKQPLDPFYEPVTNVTKIATQAVSSVSSKVADTVSSVAEEVASSAKSASS